MLARDCGCRCNDSIKKQSSSCTLKSRVSAVKPYAAEVFFIHWTACRRCGSCLQWRRCPWILSRSFPPCKHSMLRKSALSSSILCKQLSVWNGCSLFMDPQEEYRAVDGGGREGGGREFERSKVVRVLRPFRCRLNYNCNLAFLSLFYGISHAS